MKVKCEDDEFEFSVTDLRYNHDEKHDKPQRNTIEFERVVGRGLDHPLLAVEQEVSFGEGDARSTVEATYDVLHDESEIEYVTGGCTSYTKPSEGQEDEGLPSNETKNDGQNGAKNDPEQRGLILLNIVTDKGRLNVEQ